jgi:hypothetical protein
VIALIGPGRVGQVFLKGMQGENVVAVGRGESIPDAEHYLICVPTAQLSHLPPLPPSACIYVQNGVLPLHPESTYGILYFAAKDRSGDAVSGADSLFYGPLAGRAVGWLEQAGVSARTIEDPEQFRKEQGIKVGWLATFGLLGERYGERVEQSLEREELRLLAQEIAPILRDALDVSIDASELELRWRAYAARIPAWTARISDYPWRNGWLLEQAARVGRFAPVQQQLLAATGRSDLPPSLRA